eukprot:TRINITY_DN106404_c0_g1_i1.p1 TRINITY_DN106404_c0_g1~~TRINITY_DN106404_c0_g1_i1.p1  ORF type:complete len:257 (+),score=55.70 TRINITY_DN106404_c0_g1_i1:39-809(+)
MTLQAASQGLPGHMSLQIPTRALGASRLQTSASRRQAFPECRANVLQCSVIASVACFSGFSFAATQRRPLTQRGQTMRSRRLQRLQRSAAPKVKLTTTRCDLWDGGAMVLFLRPDSTGKPQLGRVGTYLDKVTTNGEIQKLIDDTGFDASPGTIHMVKLGDKGLQRVAVVGVGQAGGEDWRLAGATAAAELKQLDGGSAAMVCIDGVLVQELVEGVLAGLRESGPESLELLGAYPAGSGEAIEKAVAAVSNANEGR